MVINKLSDYTIRMTKKFKWEDTIFGEEIIDPKHMTPDERHNFIDGIFEDYTYYMKKSSVHALQYGKLLSALIKTYGH